MRKKFLMDCLVAIEMNFIPERFDKLREEFHKQVFGSKEEDWAIMDSDEAPYIFYARAFLAGYRLAKKEANA